MKQQFFNAQMRKFAMTRPDKQFKFQSMILFSNNFLITHLKIVLSLSLKTNKQTRISEDFWAFLGPIVCPEIQPMTREVSCGCQLCGLFSAFFVLCIIIKQSEPVFWSEIRLLLTQSEGKLKIRCVVSHCVPAVTLK